ncbi:MAG TPA: SwmB domain-containing protein [Gaiellaceae bacterium]|jgi:M6 family metalloprotease-like protein
MKRAALVLLLAVLLPFGVSAAPARTNCSPAQQAAAKKALAKYRNGLQKQRAAYFAHHKSPAARAAFVKRQKVRLKALVAAAACQVPPPAPPAVTDAVAAGTTITVQFDHAVTADPAAGIAVTVDGLSWKLAAAAAADKTLTLTLALAVDAGQKVKVTIGSGLHGETGTEVSPLSFEPRNESPAPPQPTPGSFFPSIAKPEFADNHAAPDPWVGEWGPKTDPYWLPSTGHLRALVVPVDFPDAQATRPAVFYRDLFTSTTPPWYAESSYGRLSFDVTAVDHWTRMANPVDAYGLLNCCPSASIHSFFQELIAKLDPQVDFSQVDAVYAVAPEGAGPHMSILLWRRWPGEGIIADGKELRWGVVGNGNFRSPETAYLLSHNLVTHETGHLLGLSDLYGRACPTCPDTHDWVGVWSMMDTANAPSAEFLGWDKWLLRWLDASQVRGVTDGSQEEIVSPLETSGGVKLVVIPVSESFLYTVEVRQPIGMDSGLCDHGVLIYTVDGSKFNGSGTIHVQPAHTDARCGPLSDAAYDIGPGEVSTFEDANVRVELLAAFPDGAYRIRVTRK